MATISEFMDAFVHAMVACGGLTPSSATDQDKEIMTEVLELLKVTGLESGLDREPVTPTTNTPLGHNGERALVRLKEILAEAKRHQT